MDHCLKDFCNKFNINIKEVKKNSEAMNRLKLASENAIYFSFNCKQIF